MTIFSSFEIWTFLAGLGIFLFGMHMIEESIRVLSGAAFKLMIRRYTNTRLKAILSGMVISAILQSSTAVSLMVLAFVGAGIMNLIQAIAVMMGAKIGTTATAWIVALFGFTFNIDSFSLPLIGVGGLGIIVLARLPRYVNISRFLVAFGFLFMGLDYMKSSADQFSQAIDPEIFEGYGVWVYAIIGLLLTAIMQSSSATIAIVLTMLFSAVIQFEAAAAMVIGANVGTTVTILLGSIGGIYTKKQAAVSQLIFTVSTALVGLLFLPFLIWIVFSVYDFGTNQILGLALFHTLFNVFGVILFYPLIPQLVKKVESWITDTSKTLSRYIHQTNPEIVEAGIEAFKKEIICQLQYTLSFIHKFITKADSENAVSYTDLENYHAEIFEYYVKIHHAKLTAEESSKMEGLLRASRNIMNSAMNIQELSDELKTLKNEIDEIHQEAYKSIIERLYLIVETGDVFNQIGENVSQSKAKDSVARLLTQIDRMDKEYIDMCGKVFKDPLLKKGEVTFLLMVNRIVTQSGRMIVYGMKALLEVENPIGKQIT